MNVGGQRWCGRAAGHPERDTPAAGGAVTHAEILDRLTPLPFWRAASAYARLFPAYGAGETRSGTGAGAAGRGLDGSGGCRRVRRCPTVENNRDHAPRGGEALLHDGPQGSGSASSSAPTCSTAWWSVERVDVDGCGAMLLLLRRWSPPEPPTDRPMTPGVGVRREQGSAILRAPR